MTASDNPLSFDDATDLVAWLKELGADYIGHRGGTFLDHLVGTARLLERWGASAALCKAGLFHSIYGTEWFRRPPLSFADRDIVRQRIGADAERLAFVFCAFERASLFRALRAGEPYRVALLGGGEIEISAQDAADLVRLVWANALEQAPRAKLSVKARARSARAIQRSRRFLGKQALRDLEAFYGRPSKTTAPNASTTPGNATKSSSASTRGPGLQSLLALDDLSSFLEGAWPDAVFVARGPVERLAGLVDHDLAALIKMPKVYTRAFFWTVDGKSTRVDVAPGQERALYDAGFTLYFHSLSSPALREWLEAMERDLGLLAGIARVSAFASRKGRGLRPHYDVNDNFVCQARGHKRWRVWRDHHIKNPTAGYTLGGPIRRVHEIESNGQVVTELPPNPEILDFTPGTVVYMPRGVFHDTETVEEESLHFNIQSALPMWKDALAYVLTRTPSLHEPRFREPILNMFLGDENHPELSDELKNRLREAVEVVCRQEAKIDRKGFETFLRTRRAKLQE